MTKEAKDEINRFAIKKAKTLNRILDQGLESLAVSFMHDAIHSFDVFVDSKEELKLECLGIYYNIFILDILKNIKKEHKIVMMLCLSKSKNMKFLQESGEAKLILKNEDQLEFEVNSVKRG